jgi:hypothetical protein
MRSFIGELSASFRTKSRAMGSTEEYMRSAATSRPIDVLARFRRKKRGTPRGAGYIIHDT